MNTRHIPYPGLSILGRAILPSLYSVRAPQ
nr:MAG TPA: hypothetical protein [Caudoviricetes sp.]